jgi:starch synthase
VFDVDNDKGRAAWYMAGSVDWLEDKIDATNGFAFDGTDAEACDYALNRAIDAWYNDRWGRRLWGWRGRMGGCLLA